MSQAQRGRGHDPGLARARTSMAWTRTALAFAGIGAVILRGDLIGGLLVLVLSVLVWSVGRLAGGTGPVRGRPVRLLVITVAVTGVSLVALGLAMFGPQTPGIRP